MYWIQWLWPSSQPRELRIARRSGDCSNCWKARARALRWEKTVCRDCGKVHRGSLAY